MIVKNPVVDTNILFDFLLWRFCVDRKMQRFLEKLKYLKYENQRQALTWYFSRVKPLRTTSHVIVEINQLARRYLSPKYLVGDFWVFIKNELLQLLPDEELVGLHKMDAKILRDHGPTDSALIKASLQCGCPIVTEDQKLHPTCGTAHVPVITLHDIQQWWEISRKKKI